MKAIASALFFFTSLAALGAVGVTGGADLAISGTTLSSYGWAEMLEPNRHWSMRGRHYVFDAASYAVVGQTPFDVACSQSDMGITSCKWSHTLTAGGAYGRCYRASLAAAAYSDFGVQLAYNAFTSALQCPQRPPANEPGCQSPGGPIATSVEPTLPDRGERGTPDRIGLEDEAAAEASEASDSEPGGPGREPIRTQGAGGCGSSPILIDLSGNDFRLSNDPVSFDLDADGTAERTNWTAPRADVAFLALDRNGNGTIDDGTELFGDHTPLSTGERAPYGYVALAEYDLNAHGGNFDGDVSPEDSVWPKLRLWIDRNHDGRSQPDELETLDQAGILKIRADYEASDRKDRFGNRFVARGKAWKENRRGDPKEIPVWDVIFRRR